MPVYICLRNLGLNFCYLWALWVRVNIILHDSHLFIYPRTNVGDISKGRSLYIGNCPSIDSTCLILKGFYSPVRISIKQHIKKSFQKLPRGNSCIRFPPLQYNILMLTCYINTFFCYMYEINPSEAKK